MHFGKAYPWFRRHDAADSSRASRVESKARSPLPTEREDPSQAAIMNHCIGCSYGACQPTHCQLAASEEAMVVEFR